MSFSRKRLIEKMSEIRCFERKLLELFAAGRIYGTTHTCVGQEACAAALYANLDTSKDIAFSNHRCHGHYLSFGGTPERLFAEIMGRRGSICSGRGGSQHLCEGHFYSQGIQGGSVPIAAGCAYYKKRMNCDGIVVAQIGDGTLGQGILYETLNIAGILQLPLLIIVEYNGMAQSTETARTTSGDIVRRLGGFGIEVDRRSVSDPMELAEHFANVTAAVRGGKPFIQVLDTFRLMAHSKGDDTRHPEIVKSGWKNDWLQKQLDEKDPDAMEAMAAAQKKIDLALKAIENSPEVELGSVATLASPDKPLFKNSADLLPRHDENTRVNQLLNHALDRMLEKIPDVQLLGEDIVDDYGGPFKVTKGLSTKYPGRVFGTPISEQAIVGLANGWALMGGHPIAEIMFADFVLLATDQIVNQAAKMHFMYDGKVNIPLTLRIVSGGYRGYGPTHSQCTENFYANVPGLKVVALSQRHNPAALLQAAVLDPNPVILVENKTLYTQKPLATPPVGFEFIATSPADDGEYPALYFSSASPQKSADVTLITYGGMTAMAEQAMLAMLMKDEIDFDYFVLTELAPRNIDDILESVRRTSRVVFVEEGPADGGVGTEWLARLTEEISSPFQARRVGALPVPVPGARNIERKVLPDENRILSAILEILD
ncbi:MAG TPA: thiamine pyrophosphate-dependent enzyme [Phycisphaerae bacterium]|nr:thiamine pyrophosphate-dependent enzyme [Phycisphaerae bacterium]